LLISFLQVEAGISPAGELLLTAAFSVYTAPVFFPHLYQLAEEAVITLAGCPALVQLLLGGQPQSYSASGFTCVHFLVLLFVLNYFLFGLADFACLDISVVFSG